MLKKYKNLFVWFDPSIRFARQNTQGERTKNGLINFQICSKILSFFLILFALLFSGCGKHEGAAGTVGTGAGAILGSAVAGRKDKGTGALLGALIGNYVGREVGKSADRHEAQEQREKEYTVEELRRLNAENRNLKKNIEKWCVCCNKKLSLMGANCCPYCGNNLIIEKFCRRCGDKFHPNSNFRYCLNCRGGVLLSSC